MHDATLTLVEAVLKLELLQLLALLMIDDMPNFDGQELVRKSQSKAVMEKEGKREARERKEQPFNLPLRFVCIPFFPSFAARHS